MHAALLQTQTVLQCCWYVGMRERRPCAGPKHDVPDTQAARRTPPSVNLLLPVVEGDKNVFQTTTQANFWHIWPYAGPVGPLMGEGINESVNAIQIENTVLRGHEEWHGHEYHPGENDYSCKVLINSKIISLDKIVERIIAYIVF